MRTPVVPVLVVAVALTNVASVAGAARSGSPARPKPSTGCEATAAVAPGEVQVTTQFGGEERWYLRHVPPSYDGATPLPLVLDLHGYLEGATIHAIHSKLGPFGDEHGFITLTPNGTGEPIHWDVALHSPSVKFIEQVLDEAEDTLCIDERRVFVSGLSNGAMFASVLACSLSDRIAAIAPVAGVRNFKRCRPEHPMPVVAFHGTADMVLSFDGGLGPVGLGLPVAPGKTIADVRPDLAEGASIPDIVNAWAKRNGCKKKPETKQIADDVKLVRYSGCDDDATVELYEIIDGGHTWPGSEFSAAIENAVGRVTFSIDADQIIWKFFQEHPLR